MSTITIKTEELVEAMQSANASLKDSIYLQVNNVKAKDGKRYAALTTCDGTTQSCIMFTCECDVAEPVGLNLGKEFKDVVSTLAGCGEEFKLEVESTFVMVNCGSSQVPVSLKAEVTRLEINKPTAETLQLKLKSDEVSKGVYTGGYAYTDSGNNAAVTNAIALMFYKDCEDYGLCITSCNADGHVLAGSRCLIEQVENEDVVDKAIAAKKVALMNGPFLMKVLKNVRYETISMYVSDKQATIVDGQDIYVMTLRDSKAYPVQVVEKLFSDVEREFTLTVDNKLLKTAATVAVLNAATSKCKTLVVFKLKGKKLEVSSYDNKNSSEIKLEDSVGEITFGLNIIYLKEFLDHSEESVTLFGISNAAPIFGVGSEGSVTMLLPVRVDVDEEDTDTQEEEKSTKKTTKSKKTKKSEDKEVSEEEPKEEPKEDSEEDSEEQE